MRYQRQRNASVAIVIENVPYSYAQLLNEGMVTKESCSDGRMPQCLGKEPTMAITGEQRADKQLL